MIGIVDYGMGNLLSVENALSYLGESSLICSSPDQLEGVDKIILPGVGAFPDCMNNLHNRGFVNKLNESVLLKRVPILGICLGMQVMANVGVEVKETAGLGWIDAKVSLIEPKLTGVKIPNVGWENVIYRKESPLFKGFRNDPDFYFVHSYHMECVNDSEVDAYYHCGQISVTAAIRKGNIYGTQFHPEKSSDFGRSLLINFLDL